MNNQPVLQNIRILDFSWVLAGPYATRILADFGAEVIKVQPLLPEAPDAFSRGYYNTWNRNKLGITLNLNKEEGVTIAKKLAAISDAVVENFTPRVMANWGIDYESLKRIKPDLIMLSMSTMGSTGPQRDYAGFGPTVHAFSGMTYLTSLPDRPPMGPGRMGEGQYIDISQLEAMASLLGDAVLEYTANGRAPEPSGSRSAEAAPHGIYRCRGDDRWCAIAVFDDGEWRRFCRVLGNPSWAEDGCFATSARRLENIDELDRRVEGWTMQHTAEEVMAWLQAAGIAAGVVQDARNLANDPQLRSRGFFVELDHPELGKTISDAVPIRLSRTKAGYRRAAPTPGQDNDYVYRELLGISAGDIAALRERGII
jgi:benzylsuccinate CoA-transferase BbsF subunit